MKTFLIVISLFICTNLNAQTQIDSVQIYPTLPNDSLIKTTGYKNFKDNQIDSCWLSKDTSFLIFRYFIPPEISNIFYSGDTIFFHYNNHSIDTLFMFNSMDSAVNYYKKKKIKNYPIQ